MPFTKHRKLIQDNDRQSRSIRPLALFMLKKGNLLSNINAIIGKYPLDHERERGGNHQLRQGSVIFPLFSILLHCSNIAHVMIRVTIIVENRSKEKEELA